MEDTSQDVPTELSKGNNKCLPLKNASIRVVTFMPNRVKPSSPDRFFFVHTGSDSPAIVTIVDNAHYQSVAEVHASGVTHVGKVGLRIRIVYKSKDDVLGPIDVNILQADITADCAATVMSDEVGN
jgi:hypothetical protein